MDNLEKIARVRHKAKFVDEEGRIYHITAVATWGFDDCKYCDYGHSYQSIITVSRDDGKITKVNSLLSHLYDNHNELPEDASFLLESSLSPLPVEK